MYLRFVCALLGSVCVSQSTIKRGRTRSRSVRALRSRSQTKDGKIYKYIRFNTIHLLIIIYIYIELLYAIFVGSHIYNYILNYIYEHQTLKMYHLH